MDKYNSEKYAKVEDIGGDQAEGEPQAEQGGAVACAGASACAALDTWL